MNFKQWDLVALKQDTPLNLSLASVYRSASRQSYTKHTLNWWQTPPHNLQTVWGIRPEHIGTVSPCVFIVDAVVNTPKRKGYLLLLCGEQLKHHPHIDPTYLENTLSEDIRLRRILPHLLKTKREQSQAVFAFMPFEQAHEDLELLIPVDGRTQYPAPLWQAHYDNWFDWDVTLRCEELPELIVQAKLVRDRHCYLDVQGLQIDIARPRVPQLLNFGAVRDTLAQVRIYPRLPHDKMESPEINGCLNFEDAVIWTSFDAGLASLDIIANAVRKQLILTLRLSDTR